MVEEDKSHSELEELVSLGLRGCLDAGMSTGDAEKSELERESLFCFCLSLPSGAIVELTSPSLAAFSLFWLVSPGTDPKKSSFCSYHTNFSLVALFSAADRLLSSVSTVSTMLVN